MKALVERFLNIFVSPLEPCVQRLAPKTARNGLIKGHISNNIWILGQTRRNLPIVFKESVKNSVVVSEEGVEEVVRFETHVVHGENAFVTRLESWHSTVLFEVKVVLFEHAHARGRRNQVPKGVRQHVLFNFFDPVIREAFSAVATRNHILMVVNEHVDSRLAQLIHQLDQFVEVVSVEDVEVWPWLGGLPKSAQTYKIHAPLF